jgi:hypothetical protein
MSMRSLHDLSELLAGRAEVCGTHFYLRGADCVRSSAERISEQNQPSLPEAMTYTCCVHTLVA